MSQELKILKRCIAASGKHHWLRSNVKWLRPGDVIKSIKDGEANEDVIYKVTTFPYWSDVHKCWDVKLAIWKHELKNE